MGKALRDFTHKREDYVLATKFLPRPDGEIAAGVSGRQHVIALAEASLKRLGLDYIDLYIYHMWDYRTEPYEILAGLDELQRAGKIRYAGISNCFAWQLIKINDLAQVAGFAPFVSVQGHYNLIFREEEREMLLLCRTDRLAYTAYSLLAAGRLAPRSPDAQATARLLQDSYAAGKYGARAAADHRLIERLWQLSVSRGESMTALALCWLNSRGALPVCGVTRSGQVPALLRSVEISLDESEIETLAELYYPHPLVGVMAQNTPEQASVPKVWHQSNRALS